MRKNRLLNKTGIVMVEFLISLAMLVGVLVFCALILKTSHDLAEDSRQRVLAMAVAGSVLERVKDTPIAGVPTISTVGLIPADLRDGTITITTNPQNVVNAQIATVTVVVGWTGALGRARSLRVSTMRSRF